MKSVLILLCLLLESVFWHCVGAEGKPVVQYYILIPDPGDRIVLEVSEGDFGWVALEHDPCNHFFKTEVLVHPSVTTSGFQFFVNGDSNYKMMDYGRKYFCGTKLTHYREIIIRVNMGEGHYQRFKLEKADAVSTIRFSESKAGFSSFFSLWVSGLFRRD
ncbi:hypothetical protein FKX85_03075 [Echinicola soli]|uniref:Uncharacterized protein n=1 Tax=Echinicola soli TaxID=2591634 RepID=A0A514CE21_9BACT|nr:hypothetical protein [Echinicola soli]QDH78071.1 hypothetical protein FKX85_03075 [Echinicola soli]